MAKKKSRTALIAVIAVLVIFLAVFIGVNKSLGGKMKEVSKAFTEGLEADYGISIYDHIKVRIDTSNNMQTIAAKYEDVMSEYRTLRFTRNELYDLLLEGKDLGAIHDANERLTEAFDNVYVKLAPLVTPKELGYVEEYKSTMDNAQRKIEENSYNANVKKLYDEVLNKFPASILKHLCWTKPPQYFE
ncbi:MAG: hypothetical protein GX942_02035 [Papillibacter sp.]|jgi:hypothetical protein|nr:hypothetical protein [Papillibacter sp.]